jgi:hypothetical protein
MPLDTEDEHRKTDRDTSPDEPADHDVVVPAIRLQVTHNLWRNRRASRPDSSLLPHLEDVDFEGAPRCSTLLTGAAPGLSLA